MAIDLKNIDRVVRLAKESYEEVMQSSYVASYLRIDGVETRGQLVDKERMTNTKEEYTKTMTCMDDVPIKRGSLVEVKESPDDADYSLKGIVMTIPNKILVDYYYTTLMFNNTVICERTRPMIAPNGDTIGTEVISQEEIPCFIQRISARQRQVDSGIDRESVNELITLKNMDIKVDDILRVGKERYRVIDIAELDQDILTCYMTYYRI